MDRYTCKKEGRARASARQIMTFAVFIAILGGFSILNRVIAPPDVSKSERRALAKVPQLTISSLASGEFTGGFENFAADSFAFRDGFREVRAAAVLGIFMQSDKSGLYIGASGAGKFERVNADSYGRAADKINKLAESLVDLNVYCAIVPDKSVYAGKYLPGFDPGAARALLTRRLSGIEYIDISDALSGDDFYRTDLHWDQTRLGGVYSALRDAMGFPGDMPEGQEVAGEFYGVYAGQMALPMAPDTMRYIEDESVRGASVSYLNARTGAMDRGLMYDTAAFSGDDPYDLFLGGAQPLIVIENDDAVSDRELYMFRDSFSSSLAPLLTASYRRITLIDLRYVDSRALSSFVDFKPGSDALFIYSSQILNNESVLLVR